MKCRLVKKAKGKHCDICNKKITETEAESGDFEYSKTKRRNEFWVHNRCWRRMYG